MDNKLQEIINALEEKGYTATPKSTLKGGIEKNGLMVKLGNVCPIFYVDEMNGAAEEIVNRIIDQCDKMPGIEGINFGEVATWDFAKDHLKACLRPVTNSEDQLTEPFLDLEKYYRVEIDNERSYAVTKNMFDSWGISTDELSQAASKKQTTLMGFSLNGFRQIDIENAIFGDAFMLVLSYEGGLHGAGAIFDTETLKKIEEINGAFYILPSSIHECIIAPLTGDAEQMKQLVTFVNGSEVAPEEKLSDSVYLFKNGKLSKVA